MGRLWHPVIAVASLLNWSLVVAEPYTPKHEVGRCAIRGTCGKDGGIFAADLPCPDNGLAMEPKDDVRKQLVELCGPKWNSGPVCCEKSQVRQSILLVRTGQMAWMIETKSVRRICGTK